MVGGGKGCGRLLFIANQTHCFERNGEISCFSSDGVENYSEREKCGRLPFISQQKQKAQFCHPQYFSWDGKTAVPPILREKSRRSNTLKAGYTPTRRRKLGKWKSRPWEWLAATAISLYPLKRKYSFVTVCVYYILYRRIFQVPFAIFLFFLRIVSKNRPICVVCLLIFHHGCCIIHTEIYFKEKYYVSFCKGNADQGEGRSLRSRSVQHQQP